MPTLYIKNNSISVCPDGNPFSWGIDGFPFQVKNSYIEIISNELKLFTGQFTPTTITPETAEGLTTKTNLVGAIWLVITNDRSEHHVYTIPGFVFDSEIPINILYIPTFKTLFGYNADVHNPLAEDSTTIKLSATKSHFLWYHGKHKRHFMHGSSKILELYLYVSHG